MDDVRAYEERYCVIPPTLESGCILKRAIEVDDTIGNPGIAIGGHRRD